MLKKKAMDKDNPSAMTNLPSPFEQKEARLLSSSTAQQNIQTKKKRNLPGMPDPDAEVIALSPKTLLATNRFVCEICSKGFQRDQNLQLHRRGHNLPWKLRQRNGDEVIRKRVYVCPEPSCVHHDPARALGDLTGVKKHFCRKHGEKKWKCERCSKKYAVVSDWKAHMKTCGTREYRCDCGTLFSRRDSFITHRAFCDALAQESARSQNIAVTNEETVAAAAAAAVLSPKVPAVTTASNTTTTTTPSSPPPPPLTPSTSVLSPVMSVHTSDNRENNQTPGGLEQQQQQQQIAPQHSSTTSTTSSGQAGASASSSSSSGKISNNTDVLTSVHGASATAGLSQFSNSQNFLGFMDMDNGGAVVPEPVSLSLSSPFYIDSNMNSLPLFPSSTPYQPIIHFPAPAISATALLQKAAQMGANTSGSSFLRSLGLAMPTSSSSSAATPSFGGWMDDVKLENNSSPSRFAPNVHHGSTNIMMNSMDDVKLENNSSPSRFMPNVHHGSTDIMMNSVPPSMANAKPTTVDFLGLGNSHGGASSSTTGRFPRYLNRVEDDGFDNIWDDDDGDSSDMKPTL